MHEIFTAVSAVVAALIGSGFIQFMINRHDGRKGITAKISAQLDRQERDLCKIEIMCLIKNYPQKVPEILELGKIYFCQLNGDTYITDLFNDWMIERKIEPPSWFVEHKRG